MATRIKTGALAGIDGLEVTAEVDISRGLPGFHLVGLPSAEVRESRERVLAALRHSGIRIPVGKITVNLAPAGIRKEGAYFDLAIAMGIVTASEPPDREDDRGLRPSALFIGELSLFGELRPVRGLLAIVLAVARMGEHLVVVPAAQAWEAGLVDGIEGRRAAHDRGPGYRCGSKSGNPAGGFGWTASGSQGRGASRCRGASSPDGGAAGDRQNPPGADSRPAPTPHAP